MARFQVDDGFAFHPKTVAAGNAAIGMWVRAGAWSMQQLSDGFIPEAIMRQLGDNRAPTWQAKRLVHSGLWVPVDGGYLFHEFVGPGRNLAREDVLASRRSNAVRQARHRAKSQDESRDRNAVSNDTRSGPVRIRGTGSQSSTGSSARGTDDDLDKIVRAIGGRADHEHARRVWFEILGRANGNVKDPVAYVLRAIGAEPGRYVPTPRGPAKSEQCPDHPGEWADGCRACAADAKAAENYDPWAATP